MPAEKKETLVDFVVRLYSVYVDLHFAYLEINPLVVLDAVDGGEPQVCYLDMAAKLDQTAESICGPKWAIARDLSVYEHHASSGKGGVNADRGPPMVSNRSANRHGYYLMRRIRFGPLPLAVI